MENKNNTLECQNVDNEVVKDKSIENEIVKDKPIENENIEDKVERIMNWCHNKADVNDVYDLLEIYEEEDAKKAITLCLSRHYTTSFFREHKDKLNDEWNLHLQMEETERKIYEEQRLRAERRRQWEEKQRKKKEAEEEEKKKILEEEKRQLQIQKDRAYGEMLDKKYPRRKLSDKKYAKLKKRYGDLTSDQIFYDSYELPKAIPVLLLLIISSFVISGVLGFTIFVFSTIGLIVVVRIHWNVTSYDDAKKIRILLGLEEDEESKTDKK